MEFYYLHSGYVSIELSSLYIPIHITLVAFWGLPEMRISMGDIYTRNCRPEALQAAAEICEREVVYFIGRDR